MQLFKKSWFHQSMIIIIGSLLFFPFLGKVHLFDWDEINFAEIAREMIVTKDYLTVQINYMPFWEKPPFFFWLQVLSMKAFGINEYAARLPNAVCGIITLLVLYQVGKRYFNANTGLLWALIYAGSVTPFLYFKSGIIDPWFNLFIFLALYCYILYTHNDKPLVSIMQIALSGAFVGMAITTKGPVGLLLFSLTIGVYFVVNRFRLKINFKGFAVFSAALILFGGLWFIIYMLNGRFYVIKDFIDYHIELLQTQDAGHGGFAFYHVIVLFLGVFPASVFALKGFRAKLGDTFQQDLKKWMVILFLVVLLVFSVVRTKIIHYSSLAYFPLTFIAVIFIKSLFDGKQFVKKWMTVLLAAVASIYAIVVGLLAFGDNLKQYVISNNIVKDSFTLGTLEASGEWTHYEALIGLFLITGVGLAIILFKKHNNKKGIIVLFSTTILFTFITLYSVVPKIEKYTQKAAVEFFKLRQGEDCYVEPIGMKSYIHLFYARKQPYDNTKAYRESWLLKGNIDKPVYFMTRNFKKDRYLKKYKDIKLLYEKNGYAFLKRDP